MDKMRSSFILTSLVALAITGCGEPGDNNEQPIAGSVDCRNTTATSESPLTARLASANAGDTLKIKGTCFGNFTLSKNVKLTGDVTEANVPPVIKSAAAGKSVITIAPNVEVEITNLTITGGKEATGTTLSGGGIFNQGRLVLADGAKVTGNTARFGGGIGSSSSGQNSLELRGSAKVFANTASLAGGGIDARAASANTTTTLTLRNDAGVFGNSAPMGAGIFLYANHTGAKADLVMDNNSYVSGNYAPFSTTGTGVGGGIHTQADTTAATTVTLGQFASIHGNGANRSGGGLYLESITSGSKVTVELKDDAATSGNVARENGGGIMRAAHAGEVAITLSNRARIVGNVGPLSGGGGGGIRQLTAAPGVITLRDNSVVQFNTNGDVGVPAGAIVDNRPIATVGTPTVDCDSPTAPNDLRAVINAAATNSTISVVGTCRENFSVNSKNLILEGLWRRASANTSMGQIGYPTLRALNATLPTLLSRGTGSVVTLRNLGVSSGRALSDEACSTGVYAGGLMAQFGTLNLENIVVFESKAAFGGIRTESATVALTRNSSVSGNVGCIDGGGIYNFLTTLSLTQNATVSSNNTLGVAGGIYNHATLNLKDRATLTMNSGNSGGGIKNSGPNATATLEGSSVLVGNSAGNSAGGGINNETSATNQTVTITETSGLLHNQASTGGGINNAVVSGTGIPTFNLRGNAFILKNTATTTGGGIFNKGGTLNIESQVHVSGNLPNQCQSDIASPVCTALNP